MIERHKTTFSDLTESLRLQAEIVERLDQLMDREPAVALAFLRQLGSVAGGTDNGKVPAAPERQTAFERVARFFAENGNQWATKAQIVTGSGVKDGTLRSIIYDLNAHDFHKGKNPEGGREKVFRLTQDALARAVTGSPRREVSA